MKTFFRFIVSRVIKIFANLIKIGCYLFHFCFPNKRFVIPKDAAPICKNGKTSFIPNVLWQTNYTNRVTLPVYINYLFNRLMSPTYRYRFMDSEDIDAFVKSSYSPEIYESYSRLQIGAAQADFWRLLVLQKNGGVYMDIDAHFVWPLNLTIKPEYTELYLINNSGRPTNYFIASRNNNVQLEKMINVILNNIKENSIKNIYDLTGPGVVSKVLGDSKINSVSYRYTCNQGNFTNEFFQYIDKPQGKWTRAQEKIDIVRK